MEAKLSSFLRDVVICFACDNTLDIRRYFTDKKPSLLFDRIKEGCTFDNALQQCVHDLCKDKKFLDFQSKLNGIKHMQEKYLNIAFTKDMSNEIDVLDESRTDLLDDFRTYIMNVVGIHQYRNLHPTHRDDLDEQMNIILEHGNQHK